jgi:hypothetical protein
MPSNNYNVLKTVENHRIFRFQNRLELLNPHRFLPFQSQHNRISPLAAGQAVQHGFMLGYATRSLTY